VHRHAVEILSHTGLLLVVAEGIVFLLTMLVLVPVHQAPDHAAKAAGRVYRRTSPSGSARRDEGRTERGRRRLISGITGVAIGWKEGPGAGITVAIAALAGLLHGVVHR
jgi:hypothetical protein